MSSVVINNGVVNKILESDMRYGHKKFLFNILLVSKISWLWVDNVEFGGKNSWYKEVTSKKSIRNFILNKECSQSLNKVIFLGRVTRTLKLMIIGLYCLMTCRIDGWLIIKIVFKKLSRQKSIGWFDKERLVIEMFECHTNCLPLNRMKCFISPSRIILTIR